MQRPEFLTDHLMAAVEANPGDIAARSALADHLEEEGMKDLAERLAAMPHEWEDHSYHGSTDYYCDCGAALWRERREGKTTCPLAARKVIEAVRSSLRNSYAAWKELRAAEERRRELLRKWGEL